ncbi:MAG: YiiX/YebB-like N1pC/P60 family cysteine hydrolase [Myxococcales bacterium]
MRRVACLALVLVLGCRAAAPPARTVRDGDIVFQHSRSAQSRAVALATGSSWTHMGVVFLKGGAPWVLEAVEPVRLTPLAKWLDRGADGRVVVKRLQGPPLPPEVVERLHAVGERWLGAHYDALFRWDDERFYCSELVYKLFERAAAVRLGRLRKAKDYRLGNPEVQKLMKRRYGEALAAFNPDEPAISPQDIFDDPKLETVFAN